MMIIGTQQSTKQIRPFGKMQAASPPSSQPPSGGPSSSEASRSPLPYSEDSDRDCFRRMPIRLLGYANELGEAFRPLVPRWLVNCSYATAGGYVLADSAWRAKTAPCENGVSRDALIEAGDSLLWQTLASIGIPGFAINRVVWASRRAVPKSTFLPTAVGLCCIPFIVHPIDSGTSWMMDQYVRPYYSILRSNGRPSD